MSLQAAGVEPNISRPGRALVNVDHVDLRTRTRAQQPAQWPSHGNASRVSSLKAGQLISLSPFISAQKSVDKVAVEEVAVLLLPLRTQAPTLPSTHAHACTLLISIPSVSLSISQPASQPASLHMCPSHSLPPLLLPSPPPPLLLSPAQSVSRSVGQSVSHPSACP